MLDALILVGVLLTLLKASDLLVLKEQQQVVERFVESFTLRVTYFDEFVQKETATSSEVQFLVFVGTIIAIWLATVICALLSVPIFQFANAGIVVRAVNSCTFAVAVFFIALALSAETDACF